LSLRYRHTKRRCSDTDNDPDRCSVAVWSLESCHTDRSPATNDAGNQGKHRVTKRRAALSNPMFTLVTSVNAALAESSFPLLNSPPLHNSSGSGIHGGHDDVTSTGEPGNSNGSSPRLSPQYSQSVHVKEEPTEEDVRPASLSATNQNTVLPEDHDLDPETAMEDLS
ncbi:unnamed protein product, partial [Ranitomeya imitator]